MKLKPNKNNESQNEISRFKTRSLTGNAVEIGIKIASECNDSSDASNGNFTDSHLLPLMESSHSRVNTYACILTLTHFISEEVFKIKTNVWLGNTCREDSYY